MIDIKPQTDDSPGYIDNVAKILQNRIAKWAPSDVCITRIDNWFDDKWVKFSGTIMHEIAMWKADVTVPPFHPNRVVSSDFFKKVGAGYQNKVMRKPLHIVQESTHNLKRAISEFSNNGLFIWFSGNSLKNNNGSMMGYFVGERDCFTFYLTLRGDKGWLADKVVGLTRKEVKDILGSEIIA